MPFRKRGVKVTDELLKDVLKDVKSKFMSSDAPEYLKSKLRHIEPVFHIVNRPKWMVYGNAMAISKWAKKDPIKKHLKLRQSTHPTVMLDDEVYFLIIEINKGAFNGITRRGLRYLVAHEFGHIFQIVIDKEVDGGYSYSTSADHDHRWYRLTRWMGGTGSEFIPADEIWI